ncbi:MAG: SIS domain-containing protein [Desulfuromonas sp.]|nr:SIS domain-containing protein [Desulfuromonas sp.]
MSESKLFSAFEQHNQLLEQFLALNADALEQLAVALAESFAQGHRLLVVGTGALSPLATSLANVFLHQLNIERPSLPAISLSPESGLAAALLANDDYERLYSCQLQAQAQAGDQVLMFDATGDDAALAAVETASELGCQVTVISCADSELWHKAPVELLLLLENSTPARAAEAMLFLGHVLCELVEGELFGI